MALKIDFNKLIRDRKIKLTAYFILERTWNLVGGFVFRNLFLKKGNDWKQLKETKKVI